jgi:hypothetical protein
MTHNEPSIFACVDCRDDNDRVETWDMRFPALPRSGERIRFRDPTTGRTRHLNVTGVVWGVDFDAEGDHQDSTPTVQCIDLGDDEDDDE